MRPHDPRAGNVTSCAFLMVVVLCPRLDAHSLLRTQGRAVIESDRIVITLDVSPEDFTHLYGLVPSPDGTVALDSVLTLAERHGDDLTASLQIWDERGEPVTGEPFDLSPQGPNPSRIPWMQLRAMRLRYEASYLLSHRRGVITFRMSPTQQVSAIGQQWVIEVQGSDGAAKQLVQLTSRGNAELVELEWTGRAVRLAPPRAAAAEAAACEAFEDRGAARFHEIFVDLDVAPDAILVRTSVPLPLLETWFSIPRRAEGRLDPAEQSDLLVAARTLMNSALAVDNDGQLLGSDSLELHLLGAVSLPGIRSDSSERLGFFTSRLETVQKFATPGPGGRGTVAWKLFNNAVVFARVAVRVDGRCTPMEFTAYSPKLEWSRADGTASLAR